MFDRLIGLFNRLINVEYDLPTFIDKLKYVFNSIFRTQGSDTRALIDMVKGMIGAYMAYVPIILIALCVIEVLFGKKFYGIQKFFICFLVGFMGGVYFIADIVAGFVVVPDYIVGAAVGLVCAILYKLFYFIGYVGTFGYLAYMVCFLGMIPVVSAYTYQNLMFSAVAALVVVIITLILRNYVEMLGTAAVGAYILVRVVDKYYFDFATVGLASETMVKLAAVAVITLIGFIVQFKTRKRY